MLLVNMNIITTLKNARHRIAHKLGWYTGICHSFWKDGKLYMSFKCGTCGKLSGIHRIDNFFEEMAGELNEKMEDFEKSKK